MIRPTPRWWHRVIWRVRDGCAHEDYRVLHSSPLIVVSYGYRIQFYMAYCHGCKSKFDWRKRHQPIWPVRVVQRVMRKVAS